MLLLTTSQLILAQRKMYTEEYRYARWVRAGIPTRIWEIYFISSTEEKLDCDENSILYSFRKANSRNPAQKLFEAPWEYVSDRTR